MKVGLDIGFCCFVILDKCKDGLLWGYFVVGGVVGIVVKMMLSSFNVVAIRIIVGGDGIVGLL